MDVRRQQVAVKCVFGTETQITWVAPGVAAVIVKITHDIWSLLRTSPDFSIWTFSHPIRRAITRFFTAQNSILGFPQLGVFDMFSGLSYELS